MGCFTPAQKPCCDSMYCTCAVAASISAVCVLVCHNGHSTLTYDIACSRMTGCCW